MSGGRITGYSDAQDLKGLLLRLPEVIKYDLTKLNAVYEPLRNQIWQAVCCGTEFRDLYEDCFKNTTAPKPKRKNAKVDPKPPCRPHRGHPCVRRLREGEPTYRCLTCGIDETCVLCKYCYNPDDHINHAVAMRINDQEDGGICDCGDDEAWNRKLCCMSEKLADEGAAEPQEPPAKAREALRAVVDVILNYIIDSSCHLLPSRVCAQTVEEARESMANASFCGETYGCDEIKGNNKYALIMWNDECHSYNDAMIAIQAITRKNREFALMTAKRIDNIGFSPLLISNNLASLLADRKRNCQLCSTVMSLRELCRLNIAGELLNWLTELSQADLPNLPIQYIPSVIGESLLAPWQIGNAKINADREALLQSGEPIDILQSKHLVAQGNLYYGLVPEPPTSFPSDSNKSSEVINSSAGTQQQQQQNGEPGPQAAQTQLNVELRTRAAPQPEAAAPEAMAEGEPLAREMFEPTMGGESPLPDADFDSLIAGSKQVTLNDLARISLVRRRYEEDPEFRNSLGPGFSNFMANPVMLREFVHHSGGLLGDLKSPLWNKFATRSNESVRQKAMYRFVNGTSKVGILVYFDSRFPSSMRRQLRDLFITSLVSSVERKQQLGVEYSDIYPQCYEICVFLDKEPESAVLPSMSTQLFTTPSLATSILKGDDYTRLMAGLYTTLTNSHVGGPSAISAAENCSVQKASLASARLLVFFREIIFLLTSNHDKASIVANPERVLILADVLSLFQNMSPMCRQMGAHVEFESQSWVYLFLKIPTILKIAQSAAQDAQGCDFREIIPSIRAIVSLLKLESELCSDWKATRVTPVQFQYGKFQIEETIEAFGARGDSISLHHPVHTFLAYLLNNTKFSSINDLRQSLNLLQDPKVGEGALLFAPPIETTATLSQIHVGLWVRNGYTVKNQMHQFREGPLRDYVFMQDLFLIQTCLAALDPNEALLLLEVKWNLHDWVTSDYYEDSQAFYMIEEYLHHLHALMTERTHLLGMSAAETRREQFKLEIVQALAFKSLPYSEIEAQVLESSSYDEVFEAALKEVADYTPPKSVRDIGKYVLKKSARPFFNCHWIHFSSARIEEAESLTKAWMAEDNQKGAYLSVLPVLPEPWSDLCAFTRTPVFARFFSELLTTIQSAPAEFQAHGEVVISKALFVLSRATQCDLIRSGSVCDSPKLYSSFASMFVDKNSTGVSLADVLVDLKNNKNFSSLAPKASALLILLAEIDAQAMQPYIESANSQVAAPSENAASVMKQKAKAEKLRVMEEFKKQQALFAQSMMDSEDESDFEDTEESANEVDLNHNPWDFPDDHCVLCHVPLSEGECYGVMTQSQLASVIRELPVCEGEDTTGEQQLNWKWYVQSYATVGKDVSLDKQSSIDFDKIYENNPLWEELQERDRYNVYPKEQQKLTSVITGCGHSIHASCYNEYIKTKASKQQQLIRTAPDQSMKGEYLCVLCRGLNNGFMPVFSKRNTLARSDYLKKQDELFNPEQVAACWAETYPAVNSGDSDSLKNFCFHDISPDKLRKLELDCIDTTQASPDSLAVYAFKQLLRSEQFWDQTQDAAKGRSFFATALLDTYAFTLTTMEISLRGVALQAPLQECIADQLTNQQTLLLRTLNQFIRVTLGLSTMHEKFFLDGVLTPAKLLADRKPFVVLVYMLYFFCPTYQIEPTTALKSCYVAVILQICNNVPDLITQLQDPAYLEFPTDIACPPSPKKIFIQYAECEGAYDEPAQQVFDALYTILRRHALVFLRQAALLVFGLCGASEKVAIPLEGEDELERLESYLMLPSLNDIMEDMSVYTSASTKLAILLHSLKERPPFSNRDHQLSRLDYAGVYHLIKLPPRLDLFLDPKFCEPSDYDISEPAICLFCGFRADMQLNEIVMPVGPCNTHTKQCACVYGIFIVPKRNRILLLIKDAQDERGSFIKAPYLDSHGDSGDAILRGRPHFLHPERYAAMERSLWLEHGLRSLVAQKLDQNVDYGGWETL